MSNNFAMNARISEETSLKIINSSALSAFSYQMREKNSIKIQKKIVFEKLNGKTNTSLSLKMRSDIFFKDMRNF